MSKITKGDRVCLGDDSTQWAGVVMAIRFGPDMAAQVRWRGAVVNSEWIPIGDLVRIPTTQADPEPTLRFEDVKDGDPITVEVVHREHPDAKITFVGTASVGKDLGMDFVQLSTPRSTFFRTDEGHWFLGFNDNTATLTAHTPTVPAWHQAKVIEANIYTEVRSYFVRCDDGRFVSIDGLFYRVDELTNVSIIVDLDGKRVPE